MENLLQASTQSEQAECDGAAGSPEQFRDFSIAAVVNISENENVRRFRTQFGQRCVEPFVKFVGETLFVSCKGRFKAVDFVCEISSPARSQEVQRKVDCRPIEV